MLTCKVGHHLFLLIETGSLHYHGNRNNYIYLKLKI